MRGIGVMICKRIVHVCYKNYTLFTHVLPEHILQTTDHNGFPVIVSEESQCLVGFVLRRDVHLAISEY